MLYFDIAMPITLFIVVTVAMLLNTRVSGKLQSTVEEKELKTRDIVLLVVFMAIVISAITYLSVINSGAIFENIILIVFLSSYTMLLFTVSYVFSSISKVKAQLISIGFGVAATAAAVACMVSQLQDAYSGIRITGFFVFAAFCFGVAVFEQFKSYSKPKWYIAAQPPAMFVLLFVFLNIISNAGTASVWFPVVMDIFGLTFAILIILYLSPLFNWKTVGLFAILLTSLDIILVFSGPMVAAANTFTGLGLPVLVYLPNIPLFHVTSGINIYGWAPVGLGLGDFFFAGVLAVQTYNKFGRRVAFISLITITIAFAIWEASFAYLLPALSHVLGHPLTGFPGTLMILSGWAPVVGWKILSERRKAANLPPVTQPPQMSQEPSNS